MGGQSGILGCMAWSRSAGAARPCRNRFVAPGEIGRSKRVIVPTPHQDHRPLAGLPCHGSIQDMNASGQTVTLGLFLAQAGALFALLSPLLGWFGTAVTGSDTSSNSLFGALQVSAAKGAGLDSLLLAAANSSGRALGKKISPQNLAVGAAAVGMAGREGELFRRGFRVGDCIPGLYVSVGLPPEHAGTDERQRQNGEDGDDGGAQLNQGVPVRSCGVYRADAHHHRGHDSDDE